MEEVFDKCTRAGETYLAFRLPRERSGVDGKEKEKEVEGTPVGDGGVIGGRGGSIGGMSMGGEKKKAGRPRKSLV